MDERVTGPERPNGASGVTDVDLSGRYLDTIPSHVFNSTNLEILNVSRNRIRELSPQIGRLTNLKELYLRDNELTALPPEIGRLKQLRHLDVSGNPLVGISEEVHAIVPQLQVSPLPEQIGELTSLLTLNLAHCHLTTLPAGLGKLTNLTSLRLVENDLRNLPPEIGGLKQLQYLDLSYNPLRTLVPELSRLPETVDLRLENVPLLEPLPEVVARGTPALFTYLRSIAEAGVPSYEAKVVLVGEGNVGKSSLVAALRGEPFVENRPTTHGVEIAQLRLPHPNNSSMVNLNMWDFGGQEIYRITQQFFFSRRALYLLVWRPREGDEDKIEAWCRRIKLRIGEDARIILVATYGDERRIDLDYPYLQHQFGHLLVGRFTIDNKTGNGVKELRDFIAYQAANLRHMGEVVSQHWLDVHESLRARQKPQVDFEEFAEVCQQNGVDMAQAELLAGLLHDFGHMIHYSEDDGLREIVVLKPEWLTKAIGYVLEDKQTEDAKGVLDHRRLRYMWQDSKRDSQYNQRHHPYFLRLMEKFDVSYRITEDESLVAQLVPHEEPRLPWSERTPLRRGIRELTLRCEMTEAPEGLVAWMTVRNHRFSTRLHWRRGIFLAHPDQGAEALIRADHRNSLRLIVRAPSPDFFFSILRDSLEDLIRKRWKGLDYKLLIPCPTTLPDGTHCQGQFDLKTLERFRERERSAIECWTCLEYVDVNQLVTGFAVSEPPSQLILEDLKITTEALRKDWQKHQEVMRRADRLQSSHVEEISQKVAALHASMSQQLRLLLKAVSIELRDCPRLFTLAPREPSKLRKLLAWQSHLRLTLWCEHPGSEHAYVGAQYDFSCTREEFQEIAYYVLAVSNILRVVLPLSSAAIDVIQPHRSLKHLSEELDFMKTVADQVLASQGKDRSALPIEPGRRIKARDGDLRALRALLVRLDPAMRFGDLRRVMTSSGDYIWVCPTSHYREYDPGLPELS